MFVLGVTRSADSFGAGLGRLRREVHSRVVEPDSTPDVQIITPFEDFLIKHRVIKALILFSTLNTSHHKIFYGRTAKYHLENGGGVVTYIFVYRESRSAFRSFVRRL